MSDRYYKSDNGDASYVVDVRINHEDFAKGVDSTLSNLDKLRDKFNLHGATKGLENVNQAVNNLNVDGATGKVTKLSLAFSKMDLVALTAMQNITNRAVDMGVNLVKSLSGVNNITSGWSKYAEKTQAVQTIMSATSKNFKNQAVAMAAVNEQLSRLTWFSDETSYSFLDMVGNIGKFTSNGSKLDESVTAMQGISTWAAISGANVQEAGRAMYNLSQAMGVGAVKLVDWKTIENANMATQEFKKTVLDTAVAMGKLYKKKGEDWYSTVSFKDKTKTKKGGIYLHDKFAFNAASFNTQLKEGWFDKEVLISVLNKYGGFSTELGKIMKQIDEAITTSEMINYVNEFKEGSIDMKKFIDETGLSAKEAEKILKKLSSSQYDLGRRSFAAAQEAKTFKEALDSVYDAASTKWMNIFELIFGDYLQAKKLWTDVANGMYDVFVEPLNDIQTTLKETLSGDDYQWKKFTNGLTDAGIPLGKFESAFKKVAKKHGVDIDTMIKKNGSLEKSFGDIVTKLGDGDLSLENVLDESVTEFLTANAAAEKKYKRKKKSGKKSKKVVADYVKINNEAVDYLRKNIKSPDSEINEAIGNLGRESGRDLLLGSFGNILGSVSNIVTAYNTAVGNAMKGSSGALYNGLKMFKRFTDAIAISEDAAEQLGRIVNNVFKSLGSVFGVVGKAAGFLISQISKVFKIFNTGKGNLLTSVLTIVANMTEKIAKALSFVTGNMSKIIGALMDKMIAFKNQFVKSNFYKNSIQPIIDALKKIDYKTLYNGVMKILGDFINRIKELKNVDPKELGTNIGLAFKQLLGDFKSLSVISDILDIVNSTIKGFNTAFKNLKAFVGEGIDQIGGFMDGIKGFFTTMSSYAKGVTISDTISAFLGTSSTVLMLSISKAFQSISVAMAASLVSVTLSVNKFMDALTGIAKSVAGIGKAVKAIPESIVGFVKQATVSLKGLTRAVKFKMYAESFLTIAKALGIVAAAIAVLSTLPKKQIMTATGCLIAVIAAVGILTAIMLKLSKSMNSLEAGADFTALTLAVIGMGVFIWVLSKALKTVASMYESNPESALVGFALVLGTLASVLTLLYLVSKDADPATISAVGTTMFALALLVRTMSKVLQRIGKMDVSKMWVGLIGLGAVLVALMGLSKVANKVAVTNGKGILAVMGLLLTLSTSMLLMAVALKLIGSMKKETIKKSLGVITTFLLLYAGVMIAAKYASENAAKAGLMIMGIATSLIIIAGAIYLLGIIPTNILAKGMTAIIMIGSIMLALSLLLRVMTGGMTVAKAGSLGLTMMSLAASIVLLAGAMYLLAGLKPSQLAKGVATITALMVAMSVVIKSTAKAGNAWKNILAITMSLGLLSVSLAVLAMQPWDRLLAATVAMSAVMLSLAAIMYASSKMPDKMVGKMIIIAAVIAALGAIVYKLAELPIQNSLSAAASLALVLTSLSASMVVLSKMDSGKGIGLGVIKSFAVLLGVVAAVGAILVAMKQFGLGEEALAMATGLSELLIVMAGVCVVLSKVNVDAKAALTGAVALIAVVGVIGGAIGALGAIFGGNNLEGTLKAVQEGATILEGIGDAIGRFIGSVLGSIAGASFEKIGTGLGKFYENAKPFFDGMDEKAVSASKSFAEFILAITATRLINGLLNWLNMPSLDSVLDNVTSMGEAITEFADSTKDLDANVVEKAASAGKAISEMLSNMPKEGGVMGFMLGNINWDDLTTNIPKLGEAIASFRDNIPDDFNIDKVKVATNAGKLIADMLTAMPKTDGVVDFFFGGIDFAKLNDFIPKLGTAIKGFQNNIPDDFNIDKVKMAVSAGKAIGGFIASWPDTKTWNDKGSSLNQINTYLPAMGGALTTFYNSVKDISEDQLAKSSQAAKTLASISNSLALAKNVVYENVKNLVRSVNELNNLNVNAETVEEAASNVSGSVKTLVNSMTKGLSSHTNDVKNSMTKTLSGVGSALTDSSMLGSVEKGGNAIINKLKSSLKSSKIKGTAQSLMKIIVSTMQSSTYSSGASQAGVYIVQGFANGLGNSYWKGVADSRARALGASAIAKINEGAGNASPSKKARRSGVYIAQGLINGIASMQKHVDYISETVGKSSIKSLSNAIVGLNGLLGSDIDTTPTIRPVLDLTSVASGVSDMNSMLGFTPSVGVRADLNAISTTIGRNQNQGDLMVVSALKDLQNTITGQSSGDVYNINGITYDDGSNISDAVSTLIHAAKIKKRM